MCTEYTTDREQMAIDFMGAGTDALDMLEASGQPPFPNRGAERTSGVIIDYLRGTLSTQDQRQESIVAEVVALLGEGEWLETKGLYGYRKGYKRDGIHILWDGSPEMGLCVQVSGDGCRYLEATQISGDWIGFLACMVSMGFHFTRIDTALDDRDGMLDMDAIEQAARERRVVTRWEECHNQESWQLHDAKAPKGRCLYFGIMESKRKLRIYDKAAEQAVSGHWLRVELESKEEYAHKMVEALIDQGLGVVSEVLYGLIDFKEEGLDSNKRRWQTCLWWRVFLDWAKKTRLVLSPVQRTFEKLYGWVNQQVAPALALIREIYGSKELSQIADRGLDRLGSPITGRYRGLVDTCLKVAI